MEHQISRKTMNIFTAVNFLKASDHIGNTVYKRDGYNGYNFGLCMTSDTFCDVGEYGDFITDLSNYAGKKYYRKYLKSTRTPLEPKFEHGEVLDYKNSGVIYLCHSVATVKKSYVIINNNPVCVPTRYLSKIETAEQKAAKERMQVINAMVAIIGCSSPPFSGSRSQAVECSATLYDAGYRK